jgi:hypothetical protein
VVESPENEVIGAEVLAESGPSESADIVDDSEEITELGDNSPEAEATSDAPSKEEGN